MFLMICLSGMCFDEFVVEEIWVGELGGVLDIIFIVVLWYMLWLDLCLFEFGMW